MSVSGCPSALSVSGLSFAIDKAVLEYVFCFVDVPAT
jgi:hypothetical protein